MKKIHILVTVEKDKESNILKNIRSLGYDASLLIGDYDIFVNIVLNKKEHIAEDISKIPGIIKLAYAENRTGELKYVS